MQIRRGRCDDRGRFEWSRNEESKAGIYLHRWSPHMPLFLEIVSEDQLVRIAELNEGLARRGRVVVIRVALEGGAVERILRLLLASRPSQP